MERLCREKSRTFFPRYSLKIIFNKKFNPQMNIVRSFSPKNQGTFFSFEKRPGEISLHLPFSHPVTNALLLKPTKRKIFSHCLSLKIISIFVYNIHWGGLPWSYNSMFCIYILFLCYIFVLYKKLLISYLFQ